MLSLQRAVRLMAVIPLALAVTVGLPGQGAFHGTTVGHAQHAGSAGAGTHLRLMHNGRIAFILQRGSGLGRSYLLATINPDGKDLERVTRACGPTCYGDYAWSPDGRRLALMREHNFWSRSGPHCCLIWNDSLIVINANGTGAKQLAPCGGTFSRSAPCDSGALSWSPNGKLVTVSRQAWRCRMNEPCESWLYSANASTGRARRLTRCAPRPCWDTMPTWSPDGAHIAFLRIQSRNESLFVVNANGSGLRRLRYRGAVQDPLWDPTWSPDGTRIAFESRGQIYTIHPDGSALEPLTRFSGALRYGTGNPVWSPDGTRIAFFRIPGHPKWNTRELWVMSSNGSHLKRLYGEPSFGDPYAPDGPEWSPDGKHIAFGSIHRIRKHTFTGMIYVIDANGAHLHVLVSSGYQPAWQPVP